MNKSFTYTSTNALQGFHLSVKNNTQANNKNIHTTIINKKTDLKQTLTKNPDRL